MANVVLTNEQVTEYALAALMLVAQKNLGTISFKKSDLVNTGQFSIIEEQGSDEVTFVWKPFGQRVQ